jgi:tetratricopeptide (TPR) repeat protein
MRARYALTAIAAAAIALGNVTANADPPKAHEIRRDPENKKGISPYMELVVKGDRAFVARDVPGSIEAYQEAIKTDPEQMLAFYRLGEAMQDSGKLDDADKAWEAALSKKGPDDLKAKVLFCIAGLRERQLRWQAGKDAWLAYSAFLQGNPKVHGFPATATDRIQKADRRMKDEIDYGKVKERIAARLALKEKEAAENAKKDKLNR